MSDCKTIVVLEQDLTVDYVGGALDGIRDFYKGKNVKLIITHTMLPGIEYLDLGNQYWTMTSILDNESVDGYIVLSGSYSSKLGIDELSSLLAPFTKKPLASMAIPLNIDGSLCTSISCESGYKEVVDHLINVHGCERFAFISANSTKSVESIARQKAFMEGIKAQNIHADKVSFFDSDFTFGDTHRMIDAYIAAKGEFPFDAVVAANDRMALGCMAALSEHGIKVPEDVKVVGYDNTQSAETSTPTLSTISQDLYKQGQTVAELLYAKLYGNEDEVNTTSDVKPIYRQSCGCISRDDSRHYLTCAEGGKLKEFMSTLSGTSDLIYSGNQFSSIYILLGVLQRAGNYESIVNQLPTILPSVRDVEFFAMFLYREVVEITPDEEFALPARVYLSSYWNRNGKSENLDEYNSFNPKREIMPYIDGCDTGCFFMHPICYRNNQYGYMMFKFSSNNYLLYSIYMRIISNFISQGQDFTAQISKNAELDNLNKELESQNTDLSRQSITDELTGILNRRGFYEYGQRAVDYSVKMGRSGLVLFADMNGLKNINDTYGHDVGDMAIKTQAEVLKLCFRGNDIVGRLSGDEFAMVAPGMPLSLVDHFRDRIAKACTEFSQKNGLPITISLSVGAVEYSAEESDLEKLVSMADEEQYIQKRLYHKNECRQ
ncbi:MAG: GGDEF domain-containing protein [Lachnospiraceae bacterium]|nr:GGDEF domain-containing protein [Lachnospiraceae bacterium]